MTSDAEAGLARDSCVRCGATIELRYPSGKPQWFHVAWPSFAHKAKIEEASR